VTSLPPSIQTIEKTAPSFLEESLNIEARPTELTVDSSAPAHSEKSSNIPPKEEQSVEGSKAIPESAAGEQSHETAIPSFIAPEEIKSNKTVDLLSQSEQPEKRDSKKGWSTWKTKIQTFFRRLFG